jgi:hypothetical protein
MLPADVDQHDLERCKDWVGEQYAEDPEQGAHQQLEGEQHGRREVDRAPRDIGHDEISVDIVHQEIDDDAPDALVGAGAEAHRNHD